MTDGRMSQHYDFPTALVNELLTASSSDDGAQRAAAESGARDSTAHTPAHAAAHNTKARSIRNTRAPF
jgi:hypothetical protein